MCKLIVEFDFKGATANDRDRVLLEGGAVDGDSAGLEGGAGALTIVAGGFARTSCGVPAAASPVAAIVGFVGGAGGTGGTCNTAERGGAIGDASVVVTATVGAGGGITDALSVEALLSSGAGVVGSAFTGASIAGIGALGITGDTGIPADAARGGCGDGALSSAITTTRGAGIGSTTASL